MKKIKGGGWICGPRFVTLLGNPGVRHLSDTLHLLSTYSDDALLHRDFFGNPGVHNVATHNILHCKGD